MKLKTGRRHPGSLSGSLALASKAAKSPRERTSRLCWLGRLRREWEATLEARPKWATTHSRPSWSGWQSGTEATNSRPAELKFNALVDQSAV